MMTKQHVGAALGALVFLAGLMGFFGIPGVIPAVSELLRPKLADVVYCNVRDQERCGDVLLNNASSAAVLTANRLTLGDDITLPAGTVIIANEIDLGGRVLRADSPLALFAREIRNGRIRVTTPPTTRSIGPIDGGDGVNGGVVLSAFGTVASTIRFELGGGDGTPGGPGTAGADGRDGRCDGFGRYRGAHAGGDGGNGGSGGNAGNGGTIDLLFGMGLVSGDQLITAAGSPGAGGTGGRQGQGGGGCTGLGGSQENENDGRPGATGAQGNAGSVGTSNVLGPNLAQVIRLLATIVDTPPANFEDARRIAGAFLTQ
jgi:hypothetical protein